MTGDQMHMKSTFKKDFFWYALGSILPMLIGFIKTPVFTRHFDTEAFGQLGIVSISFSFLGMMLFSWISSCLWRYYSSYKTSEGLTTLYSNLLFLFTISVILLGFIVSLWFLESDSDLIKELIFYSFLQLIFNQLFLAYMVVIRLTGKSRYYTVFQAIRALLSLSLALLLVFYFEIGISALVSSLVLVDMGSLILLVLVNPAEIKVNFSQINKPTLKKLLRYGSLGFVLNISLLIVSYSDRYVIALYHDLDQVGIYDQVSKIAQLSIMALIAVYFNTINPALLKALDSDFKGSLTKLQNYLYPFILIGVPIVFYLSILSEEIAGLLLGINFREGYVMMPYIFMATYLHGLSNFFELRLKFSNQLKWLGGIAVITALLNILLNFVFVARFGYQWAAYTTLISYFLMVLLFYYRDKEVLKLASGKGSILLKMFLLLTFQYLIFTIFVDKMDLQKELRIAIGLIFALSYFLYFKKSITELKIPVN